MSEPITHSTDQAPTAPTGPARTYCPRCGMGTRETDFCPRCGARLSGAAPDLQDDWPEPPSGWAQLGYFGLMLLGALVLLAGTGYLVLIFVVGGAVFDSALAIAAVVLGARIVLQGRRAFNVRRWQAFSLSSPWVWLGAMVLIWGLGIVLGQALPGQEAWVLPPLIVGGAWSASALYLSATLRGLTAPAGRWSLNGRLAPRHRVLLSTSVSATLSAAMALLFEIVAFAGLMAVMLVTTRLTGDTFSFELLAQAAEDPQTLDRLEEAIVRSPAALLGLGCTLVVIAPAIEETVKAIPLFLFCRQRSKLSERTSILIGVAGGAGFAFFENVGYLSMLADEWWLTFWFRAAAAMMHGAASGYVGRAWYHGVKRGNWRAMLLDLCKGWGIHAFWNGMAVVVAWFAYREVMEGVLWTVGIGLIPLAILFTVLARWGIWVNDT